MNCDHTKEHYCHLNPDTAKVVCLDCGEPIEVQTPQPEPTPELIEEIGLAE